MELFLYWYMFPVAIVISTIAMMGGIGGAVLFSPFFILAFPLIGAMPLKPEEAIGIALVTEVFGFSSGLFSYWRQKLIDYKTGFILLSISIPFGIIGATLSHNISDKMLKEAFGIIIILLALLMYHRPEQEKLEDISVKALSGKYEKLGERTCIKASDGKDYCYNVCNRKWGMLFTSIGALLAGMLSFGLGEIEVTQLVKRCKMPIRIAAGTSVFIITFTVIAASIVHVINLSSEGGFLTIPWNIVLMTAPGVLIGGQIGSRISGHISQEKMENFLGFLFALIGIIMLLSLISL